MSSGQTKSPLTAVREDKCLTATPAKAPENRQKHGFSRNDPASLKRAEAECLTVSPTAAARIIGIGRTTLYELIDRQEIKSFRVGARRLITKRAIEQFIADRETRS